MAENGSRQDTTLGPEIRENGIRRNGFRQNGIRRNGRTSSHTSMALIYPGFITRLNVRLERINLHSSDERSLQI